MTCILYKSAHVSFVTESTVESFRSYSYTDYIFRLIKLLPFEIFGLLLMDFQAQRLIQANNISRELIRKTLVKSSLNKSVFSFLMDRMIRALN